MNKIKLKSGNYIPQLGLGTWRLSGNECSNAIRNALNMGYSHIDTAIAYKNHIDVAIGIKQSDVKRKSLFLTSKIPLETLSYEQVISETDRSLNELQVDYLDLLLIHWPTSKVPFSETIAAFNEVKNKGYTKDIGISNFNSKIATEISNLSEAPIVTNQVEFHPLLYQKELLKKCEALGIKITAYSPLARGKTFENSTLKSIAGKHNVSVSQVCIAWLISKDIIVIPKATSIKHLKDNLNALNLKLDKIDINSIDSIKERFRKVDGEWKQYDF